MAAQIADLIYKGVALKRLGKIIGYSDSAAFKFAKHVIRADGCETREEFMAKEIDRLRKQLKER